MRPFYVFILLCVLSIAAAAQKSDDILATATGHTFKVRDLSADTQKDVADMPANMPKARTALLDQMVSQRVLDAEAKTRGITVAKFIADEKAKVKDPTEAEIKQVTDANQDKLAAFPPDKARKQVIAFLRTAPEQKALGDLFTALKVKFKVARGKDVNAANLLPTDVLVTVNGQPLTDKEFEEFAKGPLYEARADMADAILTELEDLMYTTLVADEAKSLNIDSGELIAREITNKMKDYSNAEQYALEDGFRKRLYEKYKVKVLYTEPAAPVQNVSVDDDPATGPTTAPVTIIMFSDFQCSACSATHPILKKVMAEFPGKIRFVVRDFPLESIHENGFKAALAAGAANAQGKFFEYTEILYKHQDALDAASLKKYAVELGLNEKQFELDFNSPAIAAEVRKDQADGMSYGINSTPTIFVNGVTVRNISEGGIRLAIEKALRK